MPLDPSGGIALSRRDNVGYDRLAIGPAAFRASACDRAELEPVIPHCPGEWRAERLDEGTCNEEGVLG